MDDDEKVIEKCKRAIVGSRNTLTPECRESTDVELYHYEFDDRGLESNIPTTEMINEKFACRKGTRYFRDIPPDEIRLGESNGRCFIETYDTSDVFVGDEDKADAVLVFSPRARKAIHDTIGGMDVGGLAAFNKETGLKLSVQRFDAEFGKDKSYDDYRKWISGFRIADKAVAREAIEKLRGKSELTPNDEWTVVDGNRALMLHQMRDIIDSSSTKEEVEEKIGEIYKLRPYSEYDPLDFVKPEFLVFQPENKVKSRRVVMIVNGKTVDYMTGAADK